MAEEVKEAHEISPTALEQAAVPAAVASVNNEESEENYPGWQKLTLIMVAIYLSMFLVALDRTIIGTAIPKSTVCAAAPSSKAFIVGRAIAGLGGAGILSGCINIMVLSVPLHRRPMFQGLFGAVFGVASVAGPLLGGVFTTKVSWRWCFYINLPIGAVVMVILVFILDSPARKNVSTTRERIALLDPLGTFVFIPGIVCLLLALQWGGETYAWKNVRTIVLFILAGILLSIFVYLQFRLGENATVPIRIIKQRSIAAGAYCQFFTAGAMMTLVYYLPFWFQAIKGVDAIQSGIDLLPLILSLVLASIIAGITTQKIGYYTPHLYFCCVLMSIGAGLITTFRTTTHHSKWIGYQILFGFGLGLGMQQPNLAAQTCLPQKDVMIGISLMFFFNGLGGSIFVTIAQTVFSHSLVKNLGPIANLDAKTILNTGATNLGRLVPEEFLGSVLEAYNGAVVDCFRVALACACVVVLGAAAMEWRSVKGRKHGGDVRPREGGAGEEEGVVGVVRRGDGG